MRRVLRVTGLFIVAAVVVLAARHVAGTRRGYTSDFGNTIVRYKLDSTVLGRSLDEVAIVPRGRGHRPLLVFLHGRHDPGRLSWIIPERSGPESLLSNALLQALARLGRHAPVVVLLNGGTHSYYHDRRGGRWASMILAEAIPDAIRRFDTTRSRTAIGGISMGGYGSLWLASRAPRRFCAVGGHSAALWKSAGASAPGAFDDATDFTANDVFAAARKGRYDRMPVWIDGGSSDPFRDADAAFASLLRARADAVTYHVWPGGHTASYWNAHMAAYLAFYAHSLSSCG
jgi:S-formylglutathione hydrolase FrmB